MGTNYTAGTIGTGVGQQSAINAEITAIQAALERMLSIYGDNTNGANAMQAALDMNSQRILNVPAPTLSTDVVRLGDLSTADAASALTTTITDAAAKYASDNVEGALAEILTLIEYVSGAGLYAAASGVDTITAALSPAPTVLTNGMEVHIRAAGANTSTTPTLNLNGLGAKTITKLGGQALLAGDIPRANYEMVLRYNSSSSKWELLNPSLTDVLASTTTDDTEGGFHRVHYPPLSGETGVVNHEYEYGELKRYGVIGDGVLSGTGTDDTIAMKNAVASAKALGIPLKDSYSLSVLITDTLYFGSSDINTSWDYLRTIRGTSVTPDRNYAGQTTIIAKFSGKPIIDWSNSRHRVASDFHVLSATGYNPSTGILLARPENGSTEVPNDYGNWQNVRVWGTFTFAALTLVQAEENYFLNCGFRNDHLDQRGAVVVTDYSPVPTKINGNASPVDRVVDADVDSAENVIATRYWTTLSNYFHKCDFYLGGSGTYSRKNDDYGVAGLHIVGTRGVKISGCFWNSQIGADSDHIATHRFFDSTPTEYQPFYVDVQANNFHSTARSCLRMNSNSAYITYRNNKPRVGLSFGDEEVFVNGTCQWLSVDKARVEVDASAAVSKLVADDLITLSLGSACTVKGMVSLNQTSDLTDSGATTLPNFLYTDTGALHPKRITFPAAQIASTDANALDDYEEGSWTPSVGGNATYNANNGGRSIKIGKQVTVWGRLDVNVLGTGSTTTITGLPYSVGTDLTATFPGKISFFSGLATTVIMFGVYCSSSNSITFTSLSAAAATPNNVIACIGSGTRIDFSITYEATQ